MCAECGVPVMVDSGISIFAESRSSCDKPELLMVDDFSEMNCVFAHGCRGWWYHGATFFAPAKHNVWLSFGSSATEAARYYSRFEPTKLAGKWMFGTDWPVVPGIRRNADALAQVRLPDSVLCNIYAGNAAKVVARLDI